MVVQETLIVMLTDKKLFILRTNWLWVQSKRDDKNGIMQQCYIGMVGIF